MRQQLWAQAPFALTLLLVVGIAYSLARAAWFFTAGPPPPVAAAIANNPGGAPGTSATSAASATSAGSGKAAPADVAFDVERVAGQHLFGVAEAKAAPGTGAPANAPVTTLALELLGVFEATDPQQSSAVIAEQRQDGEVYQVGQNVPGNAVLAKVFADRVVLQRGSTFETLKFPESPDAVNLSHNAFAGGDDTTGEGIDVQALQQEAVEAAEAELAAPAAEPPQALNGAARSGNAVESYSNRFKVDPNRVLTELGVQAIASGSANGYRIGSASNAPGFAQVGLQPGDVVLTVNGQAVGNVQNDRQQIDSIRSQGSARLEVQRGNRRFFVTASLH